MSTKRRKRVKSAATRLVCAFATARVPLLMLHYLAARVFADTLLVPVSLAQL